jgi:hypothetical protein
MFNAIAYCSTLYLFYVKFQSMQMWIFRTCSFSEIDLCQRDPIFLMNVKSIALL